MHEIFQHAQAVLFGLVGTLVEMSLDFSKRRTATGQFIAEYGVNTLPLEESMYLRSRAFARLQAMEMAYCTTPRPVLGVCDLLDALQEQSARNGIITHNNRRVPLNTLEQLQIPYNLLVNREDAEGVKPHLQHMTVTLKPWEIVPEQCVVVGDYWMDVEADRAAGRRKAGIWRLDVPINPFRNHPPDVLVIELRELL